MCLFEIVLGFAFLHHKALRNSLQLFSWPYPDSIQSLVLSTKDDFTTSQPPAPLHMSAQCTVAARSAGVRPE